MTDAGLAPLTRLLPPRIRARLGTATDDVVELALDRGRPPVVRFATGFRIIDPKPLEREELEAIIDQVGHFKRTNRAGIDGTLHRLSLIRDRYGDAIGLTIRIGRHLTGVADTITDLLADRRSLLLIGTPGSGKTTLLRDTARIVAEQLGPAVIVVDSHNEIGGDGVLPHPAIGMARRMQVPATVSQHDVLLEAIRNHFPEVVIIDELGTSQEAEAARTIAHRGTKLIATAHGYTLADIVYNPDLTWLVGGRQPVAEMADGLALPRGRRARLQRVEPPVMGIAVELRPGRRLAIYRDVAAAVDAVHADAPLEPDELRDIPVPLQRLAPVAPATERAHSIIPESDMWAHVDTPVPV